MFSKILIANRGEIACRVIATARRLGVATVAVHSEADRRARHVALADEAVLIGPAPAAESYLVIDKVIEAARRSGAEAIHPGYGFLSENAAFAEAVEAAGLVFIGPPAEAIRAMGSKATSKALMDKAGVPLVPGYHGADQDPVGLARVAQEIGFPVLVKASAGGGGKGMRVVHDPAELGAAIEGARREAEAAFGDGRLLIEKYLARPRHVEMQVFADAHGNAVHLFERDCSLQRRHQKVIEEAPAPDLPGEVRRRMGEAAVAAARAIGYRGAGTVEFLYEDGGFFFIEMNTRLQVEHPVTEMITGLDLVEWQLRVAAGEPLPLAQEAIRANGHAFEARLYAEDPERDFLPAAGWISHLAFPPADPHTRIDSGVVEGDRVGVHYDPMLAKLIVWDRDRASALRRLQGALEATRIAGLATNLAFLNAVAGHTAFAGGGIDTGFLDRERAALIPEGSPPCDLALALAALYLLKERAATARTRAATSSDPTSPWHDSGGWRLNDDNHTDFLFTDAHGRYPVIAHDRPRGYELELPSGRVQASAELGSDGRLVAEIDGLRRTVGVLREGEALLILVDGRQHRLGLFDPAKANDDEAAGGRLAAPMPGKVVKLLVAAGTEVSAGTPLVVLEAMKMEHTLRAPADGVVAALHFGVGEQVDEGVDLLAFEARPE